MKVLGYIFFIGAFIVGCKNNEPVKPKNENGKLLVVKNAIIKKFTLPYNDSVLTNSNSLFFYYTKSFDTSFLIHIENIDGEYIGTYYETLPKFHSDLEGYADDDMTFLFFDGFSFRMGKNQWDSVRNKAAELLKLGSSDSSKLCFDCGSYFLSYDTSARHDDKNTEAYFKGFGDYLKSTLIERGNKIKREFGKASK